MINRRELIASGVAATLLAPASLAAAPAVPAVFVSDEHIPEARAAAREAAALGVFRLPLRADITAVYEWLDLTLRESPVALAGLTTPNDLFVIERLAWDRGLRTVYRGEHRRRAGRLSSIDLLGSPGITETVRAIEGSDFGPKLGRVLASAAPGPSDYAHLVTSQHVPRRNDTTLASWLLAPRNRLRARA